MKKIIGIIVIILIIPFLIWIINDIDRIPVYPTTSINLTETSSITLDEELQDFNNKSMNDLFSNDFKYNTTRINYIEGLPTTVVDNELVISKPNKIISTDGTNTSIINLNDNVELPKLPNGVRDRWLSDGIVEKKVGKVVFNGSENWGFSTKLTNTIRFIVDMPTGAISLSPNGSVISNYLSYTNNYNSDTEHFFFENNTYLFIDKNNLIGYNDSMTNSEVVSLLKSYLQTNPLEIYYQLETPTTENLVSYNEFITVYDGGTISVVDENDIVSGIVITTSFKEYHNIEHVLDSDLENLFNIYNRLIDNNTTILTSGTLDSGTYSNMLDFITANEKENFKVLINSEYIDKQYRYEILDEVIYIYRHDELYPIFMIYNNDTYESYTSLDTSLVYNLEGYNITSFIDGKFDNKVLVFLWIIPILIVGGLFYYLIGKKKD